MAEYKGRIDVKLAEQFLGDHFDTFEKKEDADERTLCGHVENSPRGVPVWERPPYSPDGAVQGKATDSSLGSLDELLRAPRPSLRRRFHCKRIPRSSIRNSTGKNLSSLT